MSVQKVRMMSAQKVRMMSVQKVRMMSVQKVRMMSVQKVRMIVSTEGTYGCHYDCQLYVHSAHRLSGIERNEKGAKAEYGNTEHNTI
jgi:hypothetical protein